MGMPMKVKEVIHRLVGAQCGQRLEVQECVPVRAGFVAVCERDKLSFTQRLHE